METTIPVPNGVTASIQGNVLSVKGPKGELTREFRSTELQLLASDGSVTVRSREGAHTIRQKAGKEIARRKTGALYGTWMAHIRNMFIGVQSGYEAKLKVIFSHFPIKVTIEKDTVVIGNFLGERAPRYAKIIAESKVKVDKDVVIVTGPSIEDVGRTAANIEIASKITKFDRRVFQDGLHLIQKGTPIAK